MAVELAPNEIAGFAGQLLAPADPGYGEARRVWNGAIDKRPALIARCTGVADVAAAVRFARERGLPLAVRGGGHGVAGHAICDDGVVIDLSPMKGIRVDPAARTARAEGGVLWGELDRETQLHGLATTGGIVTHTGIAGLTLGGGIGWLMGGFGATVDNLVSADVVTAEGEFVAADPEREPELFWGLRGAGANFGVVTSFEYRLHRLGPQVMAGPLFFALDDAPAVLRRYRDVVEDAPDELTTILNLRLAAPLPFLPEDVHGKPVLMVGACYAGPVEAGADAVRPLRELGEPIVDLLEPKPYVALQGMFDPGVPHGWRYYWRSLEVPELTDAVIDTLVERTRAITSPRSYTIVFRLAGAIARVAPDATAFSQRERGFNVNVNGAWLPEDDESERHVEWTRSVFDALEPHAPGRVYVNFLGDEGQERVRAAFGDAKYERLVALKTRYDPDNVFRLNQNIVPHGEA